MYLIKPNVSNTKNKNTTQSRAEAKAAALRINHNIDGSRRHHEGTPLPTTKYTTCNIHTHIYTYTYARRQSPGSPPGPC
jgi:hypothetical protein